MKNPKFLRKLEIGLLTNRDLIFSLNLNGTEYKYGPQSELKICSINNGLKIARDALIKYLENNYYKILEGSKHYVQSSTVQTLYFTPENIVVKVIESYETGIVWTLQSLNLELISNSISLEKLEKQLEAHIKETVFLEQFKL